MKDNELASRASYKTLSFDASWDGFRPLDRLVTLSDVLDHNQAIRDGDEERTNKSIQVVPDNASDAGGTVLTIRERDDDQ